jgi:hypothetical protein
MLYKTASYQSRTLDHNQDDSSPGSLGAEEGGRESFLDVSFVAKSFDSYL